MVAAGMNHFKKHAESTPGRLFQDAWGAMQASVDGGWDGRVDEAWIGTVGFGGHQPGNSAAWFLQDTPSRGKPAHRVENACASSGFALRLAYQAIRSGDCDTALVAGVESMNAFAPEHRGYWLGVSGDTEVERMAGLNFAGVYGLAARLHMQEYGTTDQHLAHVAVKNHRNGANNPHAQFQKEITLEKAMASPVVADPLRLFDCCSTTDGGACVLLTSEEKAPDFTNRPVWLTGSGAATDTLALHDRGDMTTLAATRRAGQQALQQAGCTARDMDLAEVHDCFTIAEILAVEDLGFVGKGDGGPATACGDTDHGGSVVVNPSGGLKAKGHPLGATGAGQAVELFLQLRGDAGKRQVGGAQRGLTHNVGGSGATCAVHVWEAEA